MVSTTNELLGTPFLRAIEEDVVSGAVDYKHCPAIRSKHGRWRSAAIIIGVEMAQKIAFYGIAGNLINYLTGRMAHSTVMAAANVNTWHGVASMLPILGGFVADSFLGKYYTVVVASLLYILGLGLTTLSVVMPTVNCLTKEKSIEGHLGCSPHLKTIIFFAGLYLVGVGQGVNTPCLQAFGADQFDGENPTECEAKSSFFNWWSFGMSLGMLLGIAVVSYVQDNVSWGLGFGIPCSITVISLVIFLSGTSTYRYIKLAQGPSATIKIGRVFVLAFRNCRSTHFLAGDKEITQTTQCHPETQQFRFLDKALVEPENSNGGRSLNCNEVEEAKAFLRLFPIWATSLAGAIVFSQMSTFFTKQAVTLDRSIGSSFTIPAASFQSIMCIFTALSVSTYDALFVPIARISTGKPTGISTLQRIGIGMFVSIVCMVVAAIVEKRRLTIALQYGLLNLPNVTVPMSIWWLLPQHALLGITYAFLNVGLQEFFYDQMPNELRSVGLSIYLSILGIGQFLSSILVSLIDKVTRGVRTESTSWLSDNLNRAHLDYYYYLLASLGVIGLTLFVYFTKSYVYTKNSTRA